MLDRRLQERGSSESSSSTQRSSSDHRAMGPSSGVRGLSSLRRVEQRNTRSHRDGEVEDVAGGNGLGGDRRSRLPFERDILAIGAHSRLCLMGERALDVLVDGHGGAADIDGQWLRVAESCGAGDEGVGCVDAAVGCRCAAHALEFVGGVICVDADDTAAEALGHRVGDTVGSVVDEGFEDADDGGALG